MVDPNKKPLEPVDPNAQPTRPVEPKPDPYDLKRLRLDQSFIETAGVKKLLTTVPVGRPNPQDWIRTHKSPEYRETLATIELKDDREFYVVVPEVARDLTNLCVYATLYTCITRQRVVRLWPVKLPGPDGRVNEAHRSAAEAAERAATCWTRIQWNNSLKAYEMFEAPGRIPDPEWPDVPMQELIRIGFRDRLIESFDHPVIKQLLGLA
jgi:hypothetical protein